MRFMWMQSKGKILFVGIILFLCCVALKLNQYPIIYKRIFTEQGTIPMSETTFIYELSRIWK